MNAQWSIFFFADLAEVQVGQSGTVVFAARCYLHSEIFCDQARNQGGARGAFAPSPQVPKVRILILNIQVKDCSRLN